MINDLISRQAVIDAITDENIIRNMDSVMDSEMHRVKRSVIRIIASIPSAQPEQRCEYWDNESNFCALNKPSAQTKQRWIPVTERLPEDNKPVLVTHCGKYQAFVSVDWIDPYTHEWNRTCNVTAWEPMPEPYKDGKNDAEIH